MSDMVKLSYQDDTIAVVSLEDKEARNTFSKGIVSGVEQAFKQIKDDNRAKVVVVHGYDNFFACGGTQEELVDLYESLSGESEKKVTFNDLSFFRALLDCELPTISAMQGHALGGGLAFGCLADILVFSESGLYATNFMKYGFTPGMGSTYIIPLKLGNILGNEMLFTAKNYQGKALKERGIDSLVVKKEEVIPTAIKIAKELNDKPKLSLIELKNHRVRDIRIKLGEMIEYELKMHQITFAQPEVKERIKALFGN